jgi:hypothetical protein
MTSTDERKETCHQDLSFSQKRGKLKRATLPLALVLHRICEEISTECGLFSEMKSAFQRPNHYQFYHDYGSLRDRDEIWTG